MENRNKVDWPIIYVTFFFGQKFTTRRWRERRDKGREVERQRDGETERHINRETERRIERQRDR